VVEHRRLALFEGDSRLFVAETIEPAGGEIGVTEAAETPEAVSAITRAMTQNPTYFSPKSQPLAQLD
jgi:hypothetical protein